MKKLIHLALINIIILLVSTCSSPKVNQHPLIISALPDQKPEILGPLYDSLASYLQQKLGIPVKYQAASTYDEALSGFRLGKLDMVWFGGLTGVEARLQVDGAQAIVQRDIDAAFQTVFIANTSARLKPFSEVNDLQQLKGHSFTFGSSISTSGRLMPEYYLKLAGVKETDFKGPVYFSGSHDATLGLVQSGKYEAGALNSQVWNSRVKAGDVDPAKVVMLWKTPPFSDYHWVITLMRRNVTARISFNRFRTHFSVWTAEYPIRQRFCPASAHRNLSPPRTTTTHKSNRLAVRLAEYSSTRQPSTLAQETTSCSRT